MDTQHQEPFGTLRTQMMDMQQAGSASSDWSQNSYGDFKSVLSYCLMILGAPVLSFFVTRFYVLGGVLGWDPSAVHETCLDSSPCPAHRRCLVLGAGAPATGPRLRRGGLRQAG